MIAADFTETVYTYKRHAS